MSNRAPSMWLVSGMLVFLLPGMLKLAAQEAPPSHIADPARPALIRELFVPFEDLEALLGQETERVFLTRQEFDELKRAAEQSPLEQLPTKLALLSADYQAVLSDGRALMHGELVIEVLQAGLHALPLPFAGVGVRTATLDGQPASLGRGTAGELILFARGVGRHRLSVELVMPVAADAAQQTLDFQVPTAAASRIRFDVPGNVEIKSGASVVQRDIDTANNVTHFEIVPTSLPMSIVMSLNNRKLRDQTTLMARGVAVAEITQAYERLHATLSMNVLNGATDEFRFLVSDDLEVNSVHCESMSRWEMQQADGQRVLVVKLRSPTTEQVVVNIRMDRIDPQLADWSMPTFRPLDVAGYTTIVGLVSEDRLHVSDIQPGSLFAIDCQVLTTAIPKSMFAVEPGAPRIQPVAAYYSASSDYGLQAEFRLPSPGLVVSANTLLNISDSGVVASGGFSLLPEHERIFHFDFVAPQDWKVEWVRDTAESTLAFDRHEHPDGMRVRVQLPQGVTPTQAKTIWFQARYAPTQWLSDWDVQTLEFPAFKSLEARLHQGVLAVQVNDDLLASPGATENLVILTEGEKAQHQLATTQTALAYQYFASDWQATIDLVRTTPRVTARVYSFFKIETESIRVHDELVFLIDQARSRQLQFSMPESTPAEVTIRGLDGVGIKETSSSASDGRRSWTVDLAERQAGTVRLTVDFEQSLDITEAQDLALPIVRAEQVEYQTGAISIEGHSELETKITKGPRAVDIGELAGAEYETGQQLLGAFGYVGIDDDIVVEIARRPVHPLPTTIVQRAEMVSVVSNSGVCQSTGRFSLRTKSNYIEIELPEGAVLWSIFLDGKAILPQRDNARILIAIPADTKADVRDLQVVFETLTDPIVLRGEISILAPTLFARLSQEVAGEQVPIADLKWKVLLPHGYQVVSQSYGSEERSTHWFTRLLETFVRLGGGRPGPPLAIIAATSESMTAGTSINMELAEPSSAMTQEEDFRRPSEAHSLSQRDRGQDLDGLSKAKELMDQAAAQSARPSSDKSQLPATPKLGLNAGVKRAWALEGVRSLAIDLALELGQEQVDLSSLGSDNVARITLVSQRRYSFLAWSVGLLVFVLGITRKLWASRIRYLFAVGILALLVPAALGWWVELEGTQMAVLVALLLLLVAYLLESIWCGALGKSSKLAPTKTQLNPITANAIVPVLCWIASLHLFAGNAQAQQAPILSPFGEIGPQVPQIVSSQAQLEELLSRLATPGPVAIPSDAVVVPYDPQGSLAKDPSSAERLLVPYATYRRLWELAHPDQQLHAPKPPAEFAWAGGAYRVTLEGSESLTTVGKLTLEQFVDGELIVPMELSGCVLEQATVDGAPAKLQLVQTEPNVATQKSSPPGSAREDSPLLLLHTSGKGLKQVELVLRWKVAKNGGWRIAEGKVPTPPACALTVLVESANTELRLGGLTDRATYITTQAMERVDTALGTDGALALQWRDKISEASVDQGLTVESNAVFDVEEDALRLDWQAELQFRRGRRESFTLMVPPNYLIEKVQGSNVRGWTIQPTEQGQKLDVELLKAAVEHESLTVVASLQSAISGEESIDLSVPEIRVPDAMLHQGQFTLRHSSLLELRSGAATGLTRIDIPDTTSSNQASENGGPLALKPHQAYRFSQPGYELKLSARVLPQTLSAEIQSLMKISQRATSYEARILVTATGRPVYRLRIALPADLKLETPGVPGDFQWKIGDEDGRQILEIYMADGQSGQFSVLLAGGLNVAEAVTNPTSQAQAMVTSLPSVEVLDAVRQSGTIAIQVDPAFNVGTNNLQGCKLNAVSIAGWASGEQRKLTRAIISYDAPGYQGDLTVTPRTPIVNCTTVTNVKVTDRAIEETIYLENNIFDAGISEFTFLLPASMADARIQAPLLRSIVKTPVNDLPNAAIRVRLELQDSIMGRFAVLVKHDHLPIAGDVQSVPVPIIETGTTKMRLLGIENASRDELLTPDTISVERLEQGELQKLRQFLALGGKSSIVFRVREDQVGVAAPVLSFSTKTREIVQTAGARIGLAQTLMVVDDRGTYRATQEYRVENRTEPTLEIALPEGASLWTVHVAGEPVKPSSVTPGIIRIPLIKTEEGDLDYPVVLKYGGRMPVAGSFGEVEFPLIKTSNINVELSQVRLRLPHKMQWFSFSGSLGRVESESELQAGWLSFRNRQISELTELLGSSSKMYSKLRAQNNLKQLEQSMGQVSRGAASNSNAEPTLALQQQLDANYLALQQAQQQIVEFDASNQAVETILDNRDLLGDLYGNQLNGSALNVVDKLGYNFPRNAPVSGQSESTTPQTAEAGQTQFDAKWLMRNSLANEESAPADGTQRLQRRLAEPLSAKNSNREEFNIPQFQSQTIDAPDDHFGATPLERKKEMLGEDRQEAERYSQRLQQRGQTESNIFDRAAGMAGRADVEGMARGQADFEFSDEPGRGSAMGAAQEIAEQTMATAPNDPARRDAYLASLDVDIPERGQEFLFTTPGGNLSLNARSVSQDLLAQVFSVCAILLVSIVGRWLFRRSQSMERGKLRRPILACGLACLGTLSLLLGYLPVYGGISLLAAFAMVLAPASSALHE